MVIACSLCLNSANAQRKLQGTLNGKMQNRSNFESFPSAQHCGTINYPVPRNWSGTTYTALGENDYVNGTNSYEDKQKANYFDQSATNHKYLTSTYVSFGNANSSIASNLNKFVFFKVYEDSLGVPGNLLATEQRTLSEIKEDVDAGIFTNIVFATPVKLPASKKFYVSVDISNFSYPNDSIWLKGTVDGEDIPGQAWDQYIDDTWHAFNTPENWNVNVTLWIFPTVSTRARECLPVCDIPSKLKSETSGNTAVIGWNKIGDAKTYIVRYQKPNGSWIYDTAKTNMTTLTNLEPNTYYVWQVAAVCEKKAPFYIDFSLLKKFVTGAAAGVISITPNPVKDVFQLNVLNTAAKQIIISDLQGNTVMQFSFLQNGQQVSVSKLIAGTYIVRALGTKGQLIGKTTLIKE